MIGLPELDVEPVGRRVELGDRLLRAGHRGGAGIVTIGARQIGQHAQADLGLSGRSAANQGYGGQASRAREDATTR
jgi:hypothetical protein